MRSIIETTSKLESIIEECVREGSASGYFPALYRRVTLAVMRAIERGEFDDGDRMEALVVSFAKRYTDAFDRNSSGRPVTGSWKAAFEASGTNSLIVLQHLLLGMNAHINLDLGISASVIAASSNPLALKKDFYKINEILGRMVGDTQSRLTRFFTPFSIVDQLLGPVDESISLFSIEYARDKAWTQALELCLADSDEKAALIEQRDAKVAEFAAHLVRPPRLWIRLFLKCIRFLEKGDAGWRIDILRTEATQPHS